MSRADNFFCETHGPVVVEWKIHKFLDLSNNILPSPFFRLSDTRWAIEICPNGRTAEVAGNVSAFLRKKQSQFPLYVRLTIGIKRGNGSIASVKYCNYIFPPEGHVCGWHKFVERSFLPNVLSSDGTLTIFCTVHLDPGRTTEAASQTLLSDVEILSRDFKELFLSGCQGDVTIKVKNQDFVAHRAILSARSSVFRSMFEHDTEGKRTGIVNIIDCDPQSFEYFLQFLYSGELSFVSISRAFDVYVIADKYNLQGLKKACCDIIVLELCCNSVCDVLRFATMHEEQELLDTATDYFISNASAVFRTAEWQFLLTEHRTLANNILIKLADEP